MDVREEHHHKAMTKNTSIWVDATSCLLDIVIKAKIHHIVLAVVA